MDANLKRILDDLPDKPPRSRLEPYREFIEELRSRGRTYRDIADILAENFSVQVTGSGVHDFVRRRSRVKVRQVESSSIKANQLSISNPVPAHRVASASYTDEVQRKIAALRARNTAAQPGPGAFEYNPDEPLRLKRSTRE